MFRIEEAHKNGALPENVYSLITERAPLAYSGIDRIERASGITFPISYIEPAILVTPHGSKHVSVWNNVC